MVKWWDARYQFRKKIIVTAGTAIVPSGYPVKFTDNTATIFGLGKCRSDYADLRIVYWNGSSWTDLNRDRVNNTSLIFSTQAQIAGSGNDAGYYIYYGAPSITATKQPSTDADWLNAYALFGTSPDANYKAIWIVRATNETTLVDCKGTNDGTYHGSPTINDDGPMGRYLYFQTDKTKYIDFGNAADLNVTTAFTCEYLFSPAGSFPNGFIIAKYYDGGFADSNQWMAVGSGLHAGIEVTRSTGAEPSLSNTATLTNSQFYMGASTWDGTNEKVYINGSLDGTRTGDVGGPLKQPSTSVMMGRSANGNSVAQTYVAIVAFTNGVARSSFPMHTCFGNPPSLSVGSEERYGNISGTVSII